MRVLLPLLTATLVTACIPEPVEWAEPTTAATGALADSLRLELDPTGAATFAAAWTPPVWPIEAAQCLATRRAVLGAGNVAYASWFTARSTTLESGRTVNQLA